MLHRTESQRKYKEEQVVRDNLRIMRSIRSQKGEYDVREWDEQHKETEVLLRRIKRDVTIGHLPSKRRSAKKKSKKKRKKKSLRQQKQSSNDLLRSKTLTSIDRTVPIRAHVKEDMRLEVSRVLSDRSVHIAATYERSRQRVVLVIRDMRTDITHTIELALDDRETGPVTEDEVRACVARVSRVYRQSSRRENDARTQATSILQELTDSIRFRGNRFVVEHDD